MAKPVDLTPKRLGQPTATKQPTSMSRRIVPSWRRCSSIPVAKETSRSSSKAAKPPLDTGVAEASSNRSAIGPISFLLLKVPSFVKSQGAGKLTLFGIGPTFSTKSSFETPRKKSDPLVSTRMPFQSPSAWRRSALSRALRRAERPPSLSNQRRPGWEAT